MISHLPDPYENELLFSVVARYRYRMHHAGRMSTGREVFGNAYVRPNVALPTSLDSFVRQLPCGHQYTAHGLIDENTLLHYFSHFMAPAAVARTIQQMKSDHGRGLSRRVAASRAIPRAHPLSYCPGCVFADRERFGECYWRREHQAPGIEACPIHGAWLIPSGYSPEGGGPGWHYSTAEEVLRSDAQPGTRSTPPNEMVLRIARSGAWLLGNPSRGNTPATLRDRLRSVLRECGYLDSRDGQVRVKLLERLRDELTPELLVRLDSPVVITNTCWVFRMLRKNPSPQPPIRYLILMAFIDRHVEELVCPTAKQNGGVFSAPSCGSPLATSGGNHRTVIGRLGVSPHTARCSERRIVSCECGFVYAMSNDPEASVPLKTRVLATGPAWDAEFCRLYSDATVPASRIMRRLAISKCALPKHVSRLGLPARPARKRSGPLERTSPESEALLVLRASKRQSWEGLRERYPGACRKELIAADQALYMWFRRHDALWLEDNLPLPLFGAGLPPDREGRRMHYRTSVLNVLESTPDASRQFVYDANPAAFNWLRRVDREWFERHVPPCRIPAPDTDQGAALRESYRTRWLELAATHGEVGRTQLRKLDESAYCWLKRNDGEWFEAVTPSRQRPPGKPKVRDWEFEDSALALIVPIAARNIIERPGRPIRVTKAEVCRELKITTNFGEGMKLVPRTATALSEVRESQVDYVARCIVWAATELRAIDQLVTEVTVRELIYIAPEIRHDPRISRCLNEVCD